MLIKDWTQNTSVCFRLNQRNCSPGGNFNVYISTSCQISIGIAIDATADFAEWKQFAAKLLANPIIYCLMKENANISHWNWYLTIYLQNKASMKHCPDISIGNKSHLFIIVHIGYCKQLNVCFYHDFDVNTVPIQEKEKIRRKTSTHHTQSGKMYSAWWNSFRNCLLIFNWTRFY